MKKLLFVLFYLLTLGWGMVQSGYAEPYGAYIYVSPRPGATLVSAGQTIAIRPQGELAKGVMLEGLFTVTGSQSGVITGEVVVAADKATILFKPHQPFYLGERISVAVASGVPTAAGQQLGALQFAFTVAPRAVQLPTLADTAAAVAPAKPAAPAEQYQYATVPFNFPSMWIAVNDGDAADGFIFLTNFRWLDFDNSDPYLMILDNDGELVYYKALPHGSMPIDFKKQPNGLLTYFDSTDNKFHALDNSYNEVGTYAAGNGYTTDNHELLLLPNGNAILMIYDPQLVDMSQIVPGGLSDAIVEGLVLQEIDSAGNVVFQWRSWDHFQITDATIDIVQPGMRGTIDYVHGNSIDVDTDGNWIFSSRHLDEVTKISRTTGEIIWRLGGKNNQFALINDDHFFAYQHDARRLPDGKLSIFDNGLTGPSRSVTYELDEVNMTATKVWEYVNDDPDSAFSFAMGNSQYLPNGNRLIGWGSGAPTVTEIRPDGTKAFELQMEAPHVSYRAFRFEWEGIPQKPQILLDGVSRTLYFSSNGVTDPTGTRYQYEIYGGASKDEAVLLATEPRYGFENSFFLSGRPDYSYFRVVLVDTQTNARYENEQQIYHLYAPLLTGSSSALPNDPLLWLPFNDGPRTTTFFNGGSSSSWLATCLSGYCPLPVDDGRWNRAQQFSTDDMVYLWPSPDGDDYGDDYTFEAWIKTTSIKEWAGIISTSDEEDQYGLVVFTQMALSDSGSVRVEFRSGSEQVVMDGNTVINDGRWHHIALTLDAGVEPQGPYFTDIKLYVDGQPEGTDKIYATLPTPVLYIGTTRDRAVFFDGFIDEVVVYDRAFSAQEIEQRYLSFPPLGE